MNPKRGHPIGVPQRLIRPSSIVREWTIVVGPGWLLPLLRMVVQHPVPLVSAEAPLVYAVATEAVEVVPRPRVRISQAPVKTSGAEPVGRRMRHPCPFPQSLGHKTVHAAPPVLRKEEVARIVDDCGPVGGHHTRVGLLIADKEALLHLRGQHKCQVDQTQRWDKCQQFGRKLGW